MGEPIHHILRLPTGVYGSLRVPDHHPYTRRSATGSPHTPRPQDFRATRRACAWPPCRPRCSVGSSPGWYAPRVPGRPGDCPRPARLCVRHAPARGSWRTSSRAGVFSLTTPPNARAAATIRRRSSPSPTRMPERPQTRTLTTRSCMRSPMPWWGRPTGMIRAGRPWRWRWAVQATAVTTGNSPHRATLSRARMRAGSRRPSGGSGVPCVAPVMARYGMRRTPSTAGSRQPHEREERAPVCALAVCAISLGPLRIQGTLCASCLTIRHRYATRKPLI